MRRRTRHRALSTATILGLALAGSAGVSSYTLRKGDTLSVVAKRTGVSMAELVSRNGIRHPDRVLAGQVLQLPPAPPTKPSATKTTAAKPNAAKPSAAKPALPALYVVGKGETFGAIVARLGVSADALAKANRITNRDVLYLGQRLTVPGAPAASAPLPAAAPSGAMLPMAPIAAVKVIEPGVAPTYVVGPGDNASGIAKRAKTSVAALRKANPGRSLDRLTAGTVLTLPGPPVWVCPVQGSTSFVDTWGAPREGGTKHQGTDVFAARGTPAVAPVGGTLELRHGAIGGNAYYVHGDDGTTYYGAHLDAITAGAGRIEAGQQIGIVGDTGDAKGTPTHLHFEIHPNGGAAVDSYFTLDKWC